MRIYILSIILTFMVFPSTAQTHINTETWELTDSITFSSYDNLSAAASDGQSFYLTEWNSGTFIRTDMAGKVEEEFSISGISQIRDLCYDGQYFYGGKADSVIYILDLEQKQTAGTIHAPSGVEIRAIAYDSLQDAFWAGNWESDFYLIDRGGQVLDTVAYAHHQQPGISGLALDIWSHSSPQFWFFASKPQSPVFLGHMDFQGSFSGVFKDLRAISSGISGPKARGLSIYTAGNEKRLLGVIEGKPSKLFVYKLNSMIPKTDVAVIKVTSPVSGCELGSSEKLTINIANTGINPVSDIPLTITLISPNYFLHQEVIPDTILPFSSIQYTANKAFYMAGTGTYSMEVSTGLGADEFRDNDTLRHDIINMQPEAPPFTKNFDSLPYLQGWKITDANNDGYSWEFYENEGINNSGAMGYSWNEDGTTKADDWLFSPCITLDSGEVYAMRYSARSGIAGYEEMLSMYIGRKPDTSAMQKNIYPSAKIKADSFIVVYDTFSVAESGVYYLGFHMHSKPDAYKFFLDNIIIDQSVSIEKHSKPQVQLFPNPCSDYLHIRSDKPIKRLKLLAPSGHEILQQNPYSQNVKVRVDALAAGLYFILLEYENKQLIRKFLKHP
ncbi:MAG: choice-of-anchor J domain-containing protein [Bacteroidales bacterium]